MCVRHGVLEAMRASAGVAMKSLLLQSLWLVPGAGIEPARPLRDPGF